ncbi:MULTISPECIES: FtsW/RodA/SpoVE family cell cycle protein [Trueperella]|uniref:FtsW/RodA/SpoVE family cell cycle protein n=1 Tax=Trueperella TaxID=1069494 RepID=UPI0008A43D7D|nr:MULTISPECIES: FtsW/RodA/SpoVE family cell cycle protein [Trueperella]MCM3906955.1 FtsW/RodA/SpoVE family cell cycle protein [Trueperella bernardiae]MDV6238520.1 FtsW/RodA/SpoVE family cell cycle protein [Trueperella bernardiae]OFS67945.1 cell division protein [Trueperella sp. HMSC08H06]PKZ89049.1 FtsW/RodA/SpoVE family cell cycle protein [Trueperella bernardiae]
MSVVTQKTARTGRFRELLLLILALAACLQAWVIVHHSVSVEEVSALPENFWMVAGAAASLIFVAHLVIRWRAPWADPVFFPIAVTLTGLGLVMIHRIDYSLVAKGNAPLVGGQFMLAGVGVVLMVATAVVVHHRALRRFTFISLALGTILLLLPMVPGLGVSIYGARIWIQVAGFSYQPAELAKIFFAVFFAGYLVSQRDNLALAGKKVLGIQLPRARHFGPLLVGWMGCMGILAMEKDFGTALLFFGLFVAMLYVATERVSWIVIGGILTTIGVYFLVQIMPHIQARFDIWLHALDPEVYNAKYGSWQIVQGWFGMASGGLLGTGLGRGYPGNTFAANSDLIVASFGEELGLMGLLAIFSIYLLLVQRAFKTALDLRDGFGKLLASGLGFTVGLQCFIVAGGVTGIIPLTGLAIPFLSLGGSALLTNWIIIGLLIRMSDAARRPALPSSAPLPELPDSPDDDWPNSDWPSASRNTEASDDAGAPVSADAPADADAGAPGGPADSASDADRYPTEVVR